MANIRELSDGRSDGTRLGQSATDKVGFYGATPVVQVALSATPAVATTAPINSSISSSCFGFTSAQAAAIIALANAHRAAFVTLGLAST
jgi:hypothetical protein